MMRRTRTARFEIDRENGKWLGVCAGLGNHMGVDPTIVRVVLVVATILGAFPWTFIAYAIAYFVGKPGGRAQAALSRAAPRGVTREETRERMRSLDLRMQAIETYVTSSNSRLAREIEDLR
jgi:phage shock protein C